MMTLITAMITLITCNSDPELRASVFVLQTPGRGVCEPGDAMCRALGAAS